MPNPTDTATTSAPPEQPLGTMRPQTGPGPGLAGNLGPADASTRGHRPAAPTHANLEPHPHHSPPVRPTASPTHRHRPTTLQHRHVALPRPTPPAPGPSDPSRPCTPTPTSPPGAPVARFQRHPARRCQGIIRLPRHRRNPINATTHQRDRQYGPQKRHLAIPRPPARTRTQIRRTPPS